VIYIKHKVVYTNQNEITNVEKAEVFSCGSEKSKCLTLQRRKSFAFKAELFFKALELAGSNKRWKAIYNPISDVSSIRQTREGMKRGFKRQQQ